MDLKFNSYADSWHERAKRVYNGGNEPGGLPLKFQDDTFGAIKIFGTWIVLSGRFTGSEPEMKINWLIDNHFLTLSTRWSYHFDDDMLPRYGFETFGPRLWHKGAKYQRKGYMKNI